MKPISALFGFFLLFGFSVVAAESVDYTHYCYRVCCTSNDAIYVEGPPQDCIGAVPELDTAMASCVEHCLSDLAEYYEGKEDPTYVTVDQVELGVVYNPATGEVEGTTGEEGVADADDSGDAQSSAEGTGTAKTSAAAETSGSAGAGSTSSGAGTSGGLCPLGFALLLPLFLSIRK